MRCEDKWLLTGAWVTMAAVGAFSLYQVSGMPKVDPAADRLARELEAAQDWRGPKPLPGPVPPIQIDRVPSRAGFITPTEESTRFHPKFVGRGHLPPNREILVLPVPVMDEAKADQDGVSVTWRIETREVEHQPWMIPKPALPSGFTVMRECRLGAPEEIAELGPAARSFIDLSAEPRQTYHYWVILKGLETDRSNNTGHLEPVTHQAERPVSAKTPTATRLKLVGGDRSHASVRVETYDRSKKAWLSKMALTSPGEPIVGTKWSLRGLHFEGFTLVADVTDDEGVARVLSTRD